jgi:hypothetical protein
MNARQRGRGSCQNRCLVRSFESDGAASQAGMPGAFTVAGGFVYLSAAKVISRVPTAGGAVRCMNPAMTKPSRTLRSAINATVAILSVACGGAGTNPRDGGDAGEIDSPVDAAAGDAAIDHDPAGWAVVGLDIFPALVRRVAAVPCPGGLSASNECMSDAECGVGFACACAGPQGLGLANLCVPAECQSGADCGGGACLLSLGSNPGHCCSYGQLGLFCERSASTCSSGGDCPGNGVACIYAAANDRFECQRYGCSCP